MSQVPKVKKHQEGGTAPTTTESYSAPTLSFMVDGQRFDVDEHSLNTELNRYIESDPRLAKSRDRILQAFDSMKDNIKSGMTSGQFINISPGGDRATSASADFDLTDTERGLTRRGTSAKSGLFAGLTGVTRGNVVNSVVNNFLADAVSRTFTTTQQQKQEEARQAELKIQQEKEKAEQEAKSKASSDSASRYRDTQSTFNISTNLFGPQVGVDPSTLTEANVRRYWEGNEENPLAQRAIAGKYFNRIRDFLNREDIVNDTDLIEKWKGEYGIDLNAARELLNTSNIDDPNLNLQDVADSLGIGTQYAALNNRSMWDGLKGQINNAETTDKKSSIILDGDVFKNNEGKLISGWQTTDDGEVHFTDGKPTTGTVDNLNIYEGKRFTGILDTPDTAYEKYWGEGYMPVSIEGSTITNAKSFWDNPDYKTKYSDIYNQISERMNAVRNFLKEQNWSSVNTLRSDQRNPYLKGPDQNVTDYIDDSWKFAEAVRKDNGHMNFSIIREKTNDGRYRTRYNDATTDETGYIISDRYGNQKFISDRKDSRGQPVFTRDLGQDISKDDSNLKRSLNRAYIHSWSNRRNSTRENLAEQNQASKTYDVGRFLMKEGGKVNISNELKDKLDKFQTGGTIYSHARTEAMPTSRRGVGINDMFDEDYDLTSSDKAELTALAAEVAGLGLSFVPGANIASGAAGAVGSITSYAARKARGEDTSAWELAGDLALDTATAIPVLGSVAKTWKTGNSIRKALPILAKLASAGFGGVQFASGVNAALNGDYSVDTFKRIASGLTGLRYGGLRAGAPHKAITRGAPENSISVNIKGKPTQLNLTAEEASSLRGLSGTKQTEAIKKLAVNKKLAADISDIDIATTRGGFNLSPWRSRANINTTQSNSRILTPDEVGDNPILRRAAKRAAAENPQMKGAEFWRKAWRGNNSTAITEPLELPEKASVDFNNPFGTDKNILLKKGGVIKLQSGNKFAIPMPVNYGPRSVKLLDLPQKRQPLMYPGLKRTNTVNIPTNTVFTNTADFPANLNWLGSWTLYKTLLPDGSGNNTTSPTTQKPVATSRPSNRGSVKTAIPKPTLQMPETVIPDPNTVDVSELKPKNEGSTVKNLIRNTLGVTESAPLAKPSSLIRATTPSSSNSNNTIAAGTYKTPQKLSFNYNPIDVSEGLRAIFNMATAANMDTRVEAPLMSHVQEIIPGVKGDLLARSAYNRGASRIRQQADAPFTSDAGIQTAGRLGANAQAEELELQGALADSQAIRQQEAANIDASRQYASGRQAVSNQNVSTLANRDQAQRQLKNQQNLAIRQSVDNFWANQNMRAYRNQQETRDIDDALYQLESTNSPVGEVATTLGMDPNMTRSQALTAIQNELNTLYNIPEANRTPAQIERMQLLNQQASVIQQQASIESLNNRKSLIGGRTSRFTLPGFYSGRVGGGVSLKKGGRIPFEERMKLEVFKVKNKNQDSWLKEYSKWIKDKRKSDTDMQIASAKGVQQLVKQALSPKIK